MRVAGVGPDGQARLGACRVLVVGLGGLGCPASLALAGAGVGRLTLVDDDVVALHNLHRQTLYATADIGRRKADVARERLQALDPGLELDARVLRLDAASARALVAAHDLVLDCTDDVATRYALSDACAAAGVPLVQAGLGALEAQVAQWCADGCPDPGAGVGADAASAAPCYRCAFPRTAGGPTCADEGTLGPLAMAAGNLQALWAMQVLLGWREARAGRMLLLDGRTGSTRSVNLRRRPECGAHMTEPLATEVPNLRGDDEAHGPACPMPWNAPDVLEIGVHEFAPRRHESYILDVREPDEFEDSRIDGAHLVPLGQLPRRLAELPRDETIVVVCAVGGRSARATEFLRAQGFNAVNLRGGMRAWHMLQRQ